LVGKRIFSGNNPQWQEHNERGGQYLKRENIFILLHRNLASCILLYSEFLFRKGPGFPSYYFFNPLAEWSRPVITLMSTAGLFRRHYSDIPHTFIETL
jgi:hypothetical protein